MQLNRFVGFRIDNGLRNGQMCTEYESYKFSTKMEWNGMDAYVHCAYICINVAVVIFENGKNATTIWTLANVRATNNNSLIIAFPFVESVLFPYFMNLRCASECRSLCFLCFCVFLRQFLCTNLASNTDFFLSLCIHSLTLSRIVFSTYLIIRMTI